LWLTLRSDYNNGLVHVMYMFVHASLLQLIMYLLGWKILQQKLTEKSETHILPIISSSVFIWSTMGYISSDVKKWGHIRKLQIPEITLCTTVQQEMERTPRQDELSAGFKKGSYWEQDKTENTGAFYLIMALLAK